MEEYIPTYAKKILQAYRRPPHETICLRDKLDERRKRMVAKLALNWEEVDKVTRERQSRLKDEYDIYNWLYGIPNMPDLGKLATEINQ